jgi:NAD(P)-dependent dehydrogenase (short-subunit alcohol dehydrogenase family)
LVTDKAASSERGSKAMLDTRVLDAVPTAGLPFHLCMERVRQRGDSPAGRAGRLRGKVALAAEVAAAAVFLASDEVRFITGAALPVDGGKAAGSMPADRYRLDFTIRR